MHNLGAFMISVQLDTASGNLDSVVTTTDNVRHCPTKTFQLVQINRGEAP